MDVAKVDQTTSDLSVKNPTGGEVVVHREPETILEEIKRLDAETAEVLASIKQILS